MLNRRDFMAGAVAGAGAMAVLSSEPVPAAAEPTASLNVLYPHQEGAKFDLAYYRTSHIPLVTKVMKGHQRHPDRRGADGDDAGAVRDDRAHPVRLRRRPAGGPRRPRHGRGPYRCREVHRHPAHDHARQVAVGCAVSPDSRRRSGSRATGRLL